MAWDDCGAYGHPAIRTPNIDRLAKEGMRFDRAFLTTSSCSPSRASIITGRYPHNTDAEQLHWPLPAEQTTFVELLRQAGYWTAAAGKWHLGPYVKDRFDLVVEPGTAGFQLPAGEEAKQGEIKSDAQGEGAGGQMEWVPVMRKRPPDRPFFLWLASVDPHRDYETNILETPHRPEDVRVPPYIYDHHYIRRDFALYYDEIGRLDKYVGKVLEELDRQNVASNTVVLFLSDNGRPFPRDKTTLYDSGIKTPFLLRWPGRVGAGRVCPRLVSSIDIAPTVLEMAGLSPGKTMDGRSLLPLLRDPDQRLRPYIYAERHWHDYEAHQRAVRSERYKYIRNFYPDLPNTPPADAVRSPTFSLMKTLKNLGRLNEAQMNCFLKTRPPEELYDLESDPYEQTNVVHQVELESILRTMRDELNGWQLATGDAHPTGRTADEFDRETGLPLETRQRPRPGKKEMLEQRKRGAPTPP